MIAVDDSTPASTKSNGSDGSSSGGGSLKSDERCEKCKRCYVPGWKQPCMDSTELYCKLNDGMHNGASGKAIWRPAEKCVSATTKAVVTTGMLRRCESVYRCIILMM